MADSTPAPALEYLPHSQLIRIARDSRSLPDDINLLEQLEGPMSAVEEERTVQLRQAVSKNMNGYAGMLIKLIGSVYQPQAQLLVLDLLHTLGCGLLQAPQQQLPTKTHAQPAVSQAKQLMLDDPEFTRKFASCLAAFITANQKNKPLSAFVGLFTSEYGDICTLNLTILATLFRILPVAEFHDELLLLFGQIKKSLDMDKGEAFHQGAVRATSILLREQRMRRLFLETGCIPLLVPLSSRYPNNISLMYEATISCWLLSFTPACIQALHANSCIPVMHDVLRIHKRHKCARAALLCLKNYLNSAMLAETGDEELLDPFLDVPGSPLVASKPPAAVVPLRANQYFQDMVSIGMVRTLQLLSKKSFGDPDIQPLVQELLDHLEKMVEDVSSFAEFKQEVLSGRLEWSPVHKSEKFWKENIKQFEADAFSIVKSLARLLKTSDDLLTIQVAMFDFGEFVRFHPNGRRIVNTLEVKPKILEFMNHPNAEVAKAALSCTQKIMVQKWEFLGA